jgi:fluoride exporter
MTEPPPFTPGPTPGPVDPDLPPAAAVRRVGTGPIVAVVAVGGVLGALARYQAGLWWPPVSGRFDGTTLAINVLGCLLIGVLATVVVDLRTSHPLVRPFWVTGVLGGFTTFSTYATTAALQFADADPTAWANLLVTALAAPLAALLGRWATLRIGRRA